MTSAARDLMDTGTPGPWRQERINVWLITNGSDFDVAEAVKGDDARKIVLSVNALPLVDALREAIDAHHSREICLPCYQVGPDRCDLIAARDALEAALRGEGE